MIKFIIKKAIKNYTNTADPKIRTAYGKLAGIIGILTNSILAVSKFIVGLITGSLAISADGFNNLSDASSSIMTLIGFKLASKPEDKEHPYGHARMEYLTALVISFVILIIGGNFFRLSISKIFNPVNIHYTVAAIAILIISILVKLWQATFYKTASKAINSSALKAAAVDSRNDALATFFLLIGIAINKVTGLNIDGFLGMLIAVIIIISGISLIKETGNIILGKAPDPCLVLAIKEKILSYDGIYGIHDMVMHDYGPGRIFVTVHIEIDSKEDIMYSHELIDRIEHEVSEKFKINLVAHMDPIAVDDPLISLFKEQISDICELIDGIESFHDLRAVNGKNRINIIFDVICNHDCKYSDDEIKNIFNIELNNRKHFIKTQMAENNLDFNDNVTINTVITVDSGFPNLC